VKRDERLRGLSRDHHHALVLARDAVNAADAETAEALDNGWSAVAAQWESELEPHFRLEEEVLFPALEVVGEHGLAVRARAEHAEIREAVTAADGDDEERRERLRHFGNLLKLHVQFEEQELFTRAEEKLDDIQLNAVWQRSPRRDPS